MVRPNAIAKEEINEMGLFNWFQGAGAKKASPEAGPNAIDYVEWLLQYMLKTSKVELVIDTRHPLPGAGPLPAGVDPPPFLPDVPLVVNRLKILSGVNPLPLPEPVEGRFQRPKKHLALILATRFHDTNERSTCSLRMSIRDLDKNLDKEV